MTRALMIQGAGSNVGKSMLVAGLCRAAALRGLRVRPFKPQNMSNNAAVTADGGEIGRAQALQALACGAPTSVHMNPILLKPESETGAQVIVQGARWTTARARAYATLKPQLLAKTLESFDHVAADADLVLIEGAGSPAEVNLRAGDIANMGFALAAGAPVVLVGDIDRGGVIAQIVGTQAVLSPEDAGQIVGFVINKFRGDPSLFDDGYRFIEARTGWPGFGVAPWFADAHRLPAEDALDLRSDAPETPSAGRRSLRVVVPQLARIANFDDLDPLRMEADVSVEIIPPGAPLPADADLALIPGSKSTIGDLRFLREQGWHLDLAAILRRGGRVLGVCGGYQMLGRRIADPEGIEGPPGAVDGLGLLDVETVMTPHKRLSRVEARDLRHGEALTGYEIHIGRTEGPDCARPLFDVAEGGRWRPEGATSPDGRVFGAYLHGAFVADGYRRAFLAALGAGALGDAPSYAQSVEATLDALADHLETHLDVDGLLAAARRPNRFGQKEVTGK